jgi:Mg2+ and Co2+ transporter CorA
MIRLVELGLNSENNVLPSELREHKMIDVWLEVVDPSEEELKAVSEVSQVPLGFLRLSKAGEIELRIEEEYGVINFVVVRDVLGSKEAYPIILAFCRNFLVTIAPKEVQHIINIAKERMSKSKIDPPAQVTYFIIDEIVSSHYTHLEQLEEFTSEIEEKVVEKTSPQTLKEIFSLKANMISFNKTLWYERGLIFNLRRCESCMLTKTRDLFDTTHEDLTRQIDIVETYREILSDAINVHLSATSNKINLSINSLTVVIFYLTIITTVTSFPNTVATFFGISQFGTTDVSIIVAALVASTILPFVWLWRRRWLNSRTALRQSDEQP